MMKNPRAVWGLGLAGVLIFITWEVFILAVDANLVVETALGYFISPLVSVALGVIFLGEIMTNNRIIGASLTVGGLLLFSALEVRNKDTSTPVTI